MTPDVSQYAGVGVGTFLGVFVILLLRKRRGQTQGLVGGSALATALVAGFLTMAVTTAVQGVMGMMGG